MQNEINLPTPFEMTLVYEKHIHFVCLDANVWIAEGSELSFVYGALTCSSALRSASSSALVITISCQGARGRGLTKTNVWQTL